MCLSFQFVDTDKQTVRHNEYRPSNNSCNEYSNRIETDFKGHWQYIVVDRWKNKTKRKGRRLENQFIPFFTLVEIFIYFFFIILMFSLWYIDAQHNEERSRDTEREREKMSLLRMSISRNVFSLSPSLFLSRQFVCTSVVRLVNTRMHRTILTFVCSGYRVLCSSSLILSLFDLRLLFIVCSSHLRMTISSSPSRSHLLLILKGEKKG